MAATYGYLRLFAPDRMRVHEVERETPSREVIVETLHDKRRAMPFGAGAQFVGAHPQRADDVGIERALDIRFAARAAIGEAQIRYALTAGPLEMRHVHADQRLGRERICGFLERFAD